MSDLSAASSSVPSIFAAILGTGMTLLGTIITLKPELGAKMWHFDIPDATASTAEANELRKHRSLVLDTLRIFGVREFGLGASILAALWFGETKVLGAILCLGLPVVLVDGIVQQSQAGSGRWIHWGFAPLVLGAGVSLLRS